MTKPPTDPAQVLDSEIKEWHFHKEDRAIALDIYFHQNNKEEHQAALELRDAVLRLRRDGAFVAVPFFRVNMEPMGPHPVGSYEIWAPSESFVSVFSYLCMNRGQLSVLVHPLTRDEPYRSSGTVGHEHLWFPIDIQTSDHKSRCAWIGPSFPLDVSMLPPKLDEIPLQYPSLKLGYSSTVPQISLEERLKWGDKIEAILAGEKNAEKAPVREIASETSD